MVEPSQSALSSAKDAVESLLLLGQQPVLASPFLVEPQSMEVCNAGETHDSVGDAHMESSSSGVVLETLDETDGGLIALAGGTSHNTNFVRATTNIHKKSFGMPSNLRKSASCPLPRDKWLRLPDTRDPKEMVNYYQKMRLRNNEASKRARLKRRIKQESLEKTRLLLERQKSVLSQRLVRLHKIKQLLTDACRQIPKSEGGDCQCALYCQLIREAREDDEEKAVLSNKQIVRESRILRNTNLEEVLGPDILSHELKSMRRGPRRSEVDPLIVVDTESGVVKSRATRTALDLSMNGSNRDKVYDSQGSSLTSPSSSSQSPLSSSGSSSITTSKSSIRPTPVLMRSNSVCSSSSTGSASGSGSLPIAVSRTRTNLFPVHTSMTVLPIAPKPESPSSGSSGASMTTTAINSPAIILAAPPKATMSTAIQARENDSPTVLTTLPPKSAVEMRKPVGFTVVPPNSSLINGAPNLVVPSTIGSTNGPLVNSSSTIANSAGFAISKPNFIVTTGNGIQAVKKESPTERAAAISTERGSCPTPMASSSVSSNHAIKVTPSAVSTCSTTSSSSNSSTIILTPLLSSIPPTIISLPFNLPAGPNVQTRPRVISPAIAAKTEGFTVTADRLKVVGSPVAGAVGDIVAAKQEVAAFGNRGSTIPIWTSDSSANRTSPPPPIHVEIKPEPESTPSPLPCVGGMAGGINSLPPSPPQLHIVEKEELMDQCSQDTIILDSIKTEPELEIDESEEMLDVSTDLETNCIASVLNKNTIKSRCCEEMLDLNYLTQTLDLKTMLPKSPGPLTSAEKYVIKSRLGLAYWHAQEKPIFICSKHREEIVHGSNGQCCSLCGRRRPSKSSGLAPHVKMFIITYRMALEYYMTAGKFLHIGQLACSYCKTKTLKALDFSDTTELLVDDEEENEHKESIVDHPPAHQSALDDKLRIQAAGDLPYVSDEKLRISAVVGEDLSKASEDKVRINLPLLGKQSNSSNKGRTATILPFSKASSLDSLPLSPSKLVTTSARVLTPIQLGPSTSYKQSIVVNSGFSDNSSRTSVVSSTSQGRAEASSTSGLGSNALSEPVSDSNIFSKIQDLHMALRRVNPEYRPQGYSITSPLATLPEDIMQNTIQAASTALQTVLMALAPGQEKELWNHVKPYLDTKLR